MWASGAFWPCALRLRLRLWLWLWLTNWPHSHVVVATVVSCCYCCCCCLLHSACMRRVHRPLIAVACAARCCRSQRSTRWPFGGYRQESPTRRIGSTNTFHSHSHSQFRSGYAPRSVAHAEQKQIAKHKAWIEKKQECSGWECLTWRYPAARAEQPLQTFKILHSLFCGIQEYIYLKFLVSCFGRAEERTWLNQLSSSCLGIYTLYAVRDVSFCLSQTCAPSIYTHFSHTRWVQGIIKIWITRWRRLWAGDPTLVTRRMQQSALARMQSNADQADFRLIALTDTPTGRNGRNGRSGFYKDAPSCSFYLGNSIRCSRLVQIKVNPCIDECIQN